MADAHPNPYRLPRNVVPHAYRLYLRPDLEAATFTGHETVELEVREPTSVVTCNALDISVASATLRLPDGQAMVATTSYDPEAERVSFTFGAELPLGPAELELAFEGVLNDQLCGFYRSTYHDAQGRERVIATTQMEATDARRAFPCWDEPDLKATFEVALVVPPGNQGYSNGAVVACTELEDGSTELRFAPTMAMSTYLVCFIVGPLEATDPVDVDGVPVRIVYPEGKGELTAYALEVAAHALRYFTSYFAIPYPSDKLDLAAIPDFAFGAMENLGCVTFRETLLLIDPERASQAELERVVDVICHEIAHMWFGDLVTMKWWEGIWLNEAFATFMETSATDAFRPDWNRWVSFALAREAAMGIDALHSTRPIEYEVVSPADARGMFDLLTYEKGGSVLRMLEQYLGEEVFRDGVRRYLADHAYANTVTADLWDALEAASGQPVRAIMESWILQGGHPLVKLEGGRLSQQPFTFAPAEAGVESNVGSSWQVPLLWRPLSGGAVRRAVLGDQPLSLEAGAVVNAGGWGVYRTAYGEAELRALTGALGSLDPLERATLVADTWAATLAGAIDLDGFLSLAASLGLEDEPAAWAVVTRAIATISRSIGDGDRSGLAAATRRILDAKLAQLGWSAAPGEDPRTGGLRASLIACAATTGGRDDLAEEALARLADQRRGRDGALDADLLDAALTVAADRGGQDTWEELRASFAEPKTPQEEQRYLSALARFSNVDLALSTYELALGEVRTQDAPYCIMQLLSSRTAGPAVFERLKRDWAKATARFPKETHSRMVSGVAGLPAGAALLEDVTAFTAANPVGSGQRTVVQAVERLGVTNAFAQRIAATAAQTFTAVVAR